MESDFILVHCPNGHDLQASRGNIGLMLACPICNAAFKAEPPAPPPEAVAVAGGMSPISATAPWLQPPRYTRFLIGLWIFLDTTVLMSFFIQTGDGSGTTDPLPPLGAFPNCFSLVLLVTAFVLQLMWINRLHSDAARLHGYSTVSPSIAVGLTLVPGFNYAWVAWTLHQLARHVSWQRRERGANGQTLEHLTLPCIIFGAMQGMLLGARCFFFMRAVAAIEKDVPKGATPLSLTQEEQLKLVSKLAAALPMDSLMVIAAAGLAITVFYAITLFKVQALVYRHPSGPQDARATPPDLR